MVQISKEHSIAHQWTEYRASCACGWHTADPFLTVTDVAMQGSDFLPAYIEGRLDQVKAMHRCTEQS